MIQLGDIVYTICHYINPKTSRRTIYYSKKEVVGINRAENGAVVYTAGLHRELKFIQDQSGKCFSIKKSGKPVFLTEEEARVERYKQIEEWKNRSKEEAESED